MLVDNKKVRFDYEILDTVEAGLMLTGQEVKSVRQGQLSLRGSFVTFHGKKAMITNAHITQYPFAGLIKDYDPTASRRLLLHKREINYLRAKSLEAGLTIVPLKVYTKNHLIKVEIGVGRGRKKFDKREVLKKRDQEREIRRTISK